MAKKRKATLQTATLFDFFGKPAQGQKKAKLQSGAASKKHTKPQRGLVPSGEILVIDSDEENFETEHEVRAGLSRSEPITIDDEDDTSDILQGPVSPTKNERDDDCSMSRLQPAGESLFGRPSNLLREPSAAASELSMFGVPTMLLPSLSTVSTADARQVRADVSEFQAGPSSAPAFQPSNNAEKGPAEEPHSVSHMDEWATGDDEIELVGDPELAAHREEEDADAVDIDLTVGEDDFLPPAQPQDHTATCPLCEKLLKGLSEREMQEHVNACIDATSEPPAPSGSTSVPSNPMSIRPIPPSRPPLAAPVEQERGPSPVASIDDDDTDNLPGPSSGAGVFSKLMSSHQENEAWKEASVAEDRNFRPNKGNGGRRKAPFYKVMQGMPIAVDAFRYGTIPGVTAYFLTHAHSDHYTNLSGNWKSGPIYCSEGTANLIVHMLGVDRKWVRPLPMDTPTTVPDTGGVRVTLIEANHCPGSCLFLFEGPQTVNAGDSTFKSKFVGSPKTFRYLHCGDFRASPQHVLHPAIQGKRIDHVYLDTTYLDPKYCFPPQPQVISACAELARRFVKGESLHDAEDIAKAKKNKTMDSWLTTSEKPAVSKESKQDRVLVVIGTYSIGKERIVKAIARILQTKVYCDQRKAAILRCQADPELETLLTKDPLEGGVHLVPLGVIASDRLKEYVERFKGHFSKAVAFRPTGWTFSAPTGSDMIPSVSTIISRSQSRAFSFAQLNPMRNSSTTLQIYGVPYSEHSSFFELTCFALSLDWGKMIATVNVGSEKSRRKMAIWIERWEAERKRRVNGEIVEFRAPDFW